MDYDDLVNVLNTRIKIQKENNLHCVYMLKVQLKGDIDEVILKTIKYFEDLGYSIQMCLCENRKTILSEIIIIWK